MDLEILLTSRDGFGLENATLLQRAKCRITDGIDTSDLLARATPFERRCVETAIGCDPSHLPLGAPPVEAHDLGPIRTGKSLEMAALSVARSRTIDVGIIKPGEEPPRIAILATELDNAHALRGHLQIIHERPLLKAFFVGETADSVFLRHPSGLIIEIAVIAAKRGGYSLASRWLGSALFDEAPGWHGTGNVVNLEESRDQALGRLLPGGQLFFGGSKWQPSGHCFEQHRDHFGKPTRELVIISPQEVDGVSPARQLNPAHWTEEREARVQAASKRAFVMNVLNLFGGSENAFASKDELDPVMQEELPAGMVWSGSALGALDTSQAKETGDGICMVVAFHARAEQARRARMVMSHGFPVYPARDEYGRIIYDDLPSGTVLRIAEVQGWEGAGVRGMTIIDIVAAIAARCRAWNITSLFGDQFESTAIGGLLSQHGIRYRPYAWTEASKANSIGGTLRRHIREKTISIVPHAELYRELLSIREVPRPGGRWGYETGGLDYASALISLMHGLSDPESIGLDAKPSVRITDAPHQLHRGGRATVGGR